MAQREKNSASAWDFFNLLINISEVLRHIFTCGIDSSTSGNPTPGEAINDVAVLSPLPDIYFDNEHMNCEVFGWSCHNWLAML